MALLYAYDTSHLTEWKVENGKLEFEWDSENMKQISHSVHLLFKGCTYKKGCTSNVVVRRMGKSVDQVALARIVKPCLAVPQVCSMKITLEVEHEELLLDNVR